MAKNEFALMTPERRAECGRKGGYAKKEASMRRKALRETLSVLMDMPVGKGKVVDAESVRSFGELKGKNITTGQAMMVVLMQKALKGDLSAITMIRDTIGEKPVENVNVDAKVTNNPISEFTTDELRELIAKHDTD